MKKIFAFIVILFLGLSLISLISADQQLPYCIAGGDNELVIPCLTDPELSFIGGLTPSSIWGLIGTGPDQTTVPKEQITIVEEEKEKPPILYIFLIIFFISLLIFFYNKGKKQKAKELKKEKEVNREETKNLNSLTD